MKSLFILYLCMVVASWISVHSLISKSEAKYYETLESNPEDSYQAIKAKYRKLALKYHPDRNQHDTTDKMRELNESFDYISRHVGKGEERTFSTRGQFIFEMAQKMWEDIPEERRTSLATKINEYRESEDITEDFTLFFNNIFSPQDQGFWFDLLTNLFLIGLLLSTVGFLTLLYFVFRIARFIVRLLWRLVFAVLRFVWWILAGAPQKTKNE